MSDLEVFLNLPQAPFVIIALAIAPMIIWNLFRSNSDNDNSSEEDQS